MKVSGNITKQMVKVKNKIFILDLLILTLHDDSIGKWFGVNGDIYYGEWKDN